jgi:hypothetical protein
MLAGLCSCLCGQAIGLSAEYLGTDVRDVETVVPVLAGKDVYVMSQQDYSVRRFC